MSELGRELPFQAASKSPAWWDVFELLPADGAVLNIGQRQELAKAIVAKLESRTVQSEDASCLSWSDAMELAKEMARNNELGGSLSDILGMIARAAQRGYARGVSVQQANSVTDELW